MATEKFHYLPKGAPKTKEIILPRFGQIPGGIFRKLRKADELEQFYGLLEVLLEKKMCTEKALDLIDELTLEQQMDMMKEWQNDSEMAGVPGILGLLDYCDEHREAISADLIRLGLRFRNAGTPDFEWCDLRAIILTLASDRSSALFRELYPEYVEWDLGAHLAADAVDLLHLLVWMKTKDGSKGRNRPKPYPRPGVEDADSSKKVRKGDVITLDAARDLFALPAAN
ncbi:tail assembly chaperone [Gordonia phage Holliday]|nr:tail assembly chaperone [Gordonia phage Holliday]